MIARTLRFCFFSYALGVLACGPHGGKPKVATGPARLETRSKRVGEVCGPAGAVVDQQSNPVDMNNEASVMAAVGHPIFVCTPVRRATAGRVISETTSGPVAGAVVTIESWHARNPIGGLAANRRLLKTVDARTDANGNWQVAEEASWMEGVLAADGLPFILTSYCVRAEGYSTFVFDPWKRDERGADGAVSNISLRSGADRPAKLDASVSSCGLPLGPPL